MASTCIHLNVGRLSAETLGVPEAEAGMYYLGCIAPDSVNLEEFAPKKVRWEAHLRDKKLETWYQNAAAFWHDRVPAPPDGDVLTLGYAVHCITDAVWDEYFHDDLQTPLSHLALPPLTDDGPLWDDCYRYDYEALRLPWWKDKIVPALEAARAQDVGVIDARRLDLYRQGVLTEYPDMLPEGDPWLVTPHLVERLARQVCKKCLKLGVCLSSPDSV